MKDILERNSATSAEALKEQSCGASVESVELREDWKDPDSVARLVNIVGVRTRNIFRWRRAAASYKPF